MTKTEVHIRRKTQGNGSGETQFDIDVLLDGEFDKRAKVILFNSARSCDVSKILGGKINFRYQLLGN